MPSDVQLTITRNYGETAAEKSNELLWHMLLSVLSVSALIWLVLGRREAAVVLMGDQPGVTGDEVRALTARFRATRAQIVRLRYADGPGPALLSREIYAEAGHLHGDVGARILIASHPEWVEEVDVDRQAPRDIDTPQDLER